MTSLSSQPPVAPQRRSAPPVVTRSAHEPAPCDAVYLGFGLTSREGLGTGRLPLDAVGMVLLAASERDAVGARRIVHLIADRHALYNGFATRRAVARSALVAEAELCRLRDRLGLEDYEIVRASEIDDPLHAQLIEEAAAGCPDPYAVRQAADVEWAWRRHGAGVKIGWALDARPEGGEHDERYFDRAHREVFGASVAHVYAPAGRAVDAQRPRCSPYTLLPAQRRLTLTSGRAEIDDCLGSSSMRRHLRPLCSAALQHFGVLTDAPLGDQLELLLVLLGDHPSGPRGRDGRRFRAARRASAVGT